MRSIKEFVNDIRRKAMLLFLLVALFHLFELVYTIWSVHAVPLPSFEWLQFLWVFLYAICWLFICDLRRWAAWGYLGLTTLNIVLRLAVKSHSLGELVTNSVFPTDLFFSLIILYFYKKFE